jgi:hypothetical protein
MNVNEHNAMMARLAETKVGDQVFLFDGRRFVTTCTVTKRTPKRIFLSGSEFNVEGGRAIGDKSSIYRGRRIEPFSQEALDAMKTKADAEIAIANARRALRGAADRLVTSAFSLDIARIESLTAMVAALAVETEKP